MINCTVSGNRATRLVAGIASRNFSSSVSNSIIFGNTLDQGGTTPNLDPNWFRDSRIRNTLFSENLNEDLPGNPFGDPLFVDPDGPDGVLGTLDDDYRLLLSSPALDTGDLSLLPANVTLDYQLQPRVENLHIDLGALEGAMPARFSLLHPNLDREGDANQNGRSNFHDYALGGNPEAASQTSLEPMFIGNRFFYFIRNNDPTLSTRFEKSFDLRSWDDFRETTDFTIQIPAEIQGGKIRHEVELVVPNPKRIFLRQIIGESGN